MKAREMLKELELRQEALTEKVKGLTDVREIKKLERQQDLLAERIKKLTRKRMDMLLIRCIDLLMGTGEVTPYCTDKKSVGIALMHYQKSSLRIEGSLFMFSPNNACYRVAAYFEGHHVLESAGPWTKKKGLMGALLAIIYTPGDWEDVIQKIRPKKWREVS